MTLDLEEVTGDGSKTTVVVERNTLAIREAVGGFVKAYNDLRKTVGELTMFNADTGAAGELLGDGALRTVESRLRGVLSGGVGEGQFRMLSDIGISLQRDGTLKLDEQKMSGIVASDPQALSVFFAGEDKSGGLAGRLGDTLDQVLRDRGLLDNAKRGLESRISGLKDRYERMERSIEQTIQRYRVQFGQLDAMIANMNQVSDYLFQQFDIMNAQLGRKK
ncbi:flagellar filament capping protein FliD [Halomonas sp. E19]|uniref:flagellar filament capping protein FliD n=1 Tax=Halomonas sp. E19 TaxID=3397247 RepID=UPI0040342F35